MILPRLEKAGSFLKETAGFCLSRREEYRKLFITITLVFFVVLGGAAFPIYNLNKDWPTTLTISILISAIGYSGMLGVAEIALFPKAKIYHIIPLNLGMTLLSMGCRYLLEYGEVSNTYNFTVPNVVLHIVAVLVISTGFWSNAASTKE